MGIHLEATAAGGQLGSQRWARGKEDRVKDKVI
jgi:hypothetical protein